MGGALTVFSGTSADGEGGMSGKRRLMAAGPAMDLMAGRGACASGQNDNPWELKFRLGAWVSIQRSGAAALSPERMQQLSKVEWSLCPQAVDHPWHWSSWRYVRATDAPLVGSDRATRLQSPS